MLLPTILFMTMALSGLRTNVAASDTSTNLVQNPGFEDVTGTTLKDWTTSGDPSYRQEIQVGYVAPWYADSRSYMGSYAAATAESDSAILSQDIVGTQPHVCYKVTYFSRWYTLGGARPTLTVKFGDASFSDPFSNKAYTQHTFFGRASIANEILTFTANTHSSAVFVDDVRVTAASLEEQAQCSPLPSGKFSSLGRRLAKRFDTWQ